MRYVLPLLSMLAASTAAADEVPISILNWNIANLAAGDNVSLRDETHKRSAEDFLGLQQILRDANPDIVALQEIGSIAAAKRVLGSDYEIVFEARCSSEKCDADHGDIYTVIAYQKDLPLSDIEAFQLTDLSVPHVSECGGEPRNVRGGVGISFTHDGAPFSVLSLHLKASCADEDSNDHIKRPDLADDCRVLDQQIELLKNWILKQTSAGVTVIAAGDYNRKFLESGYRHAATLRSAIPTIRFEPSTESTCWPKNYPQSRSYRIRQLYQKYGTPVSSDGIKLNWSPYMPSSIESRDFFLVAGPASERVDGADQVLMRPESLVHDPVSGGLTKDQWVELENQAASFGVRFDEPGGYISTCSEPKPGELPEPKPFTGGTTVLGFQNVYPSDHCPITIELR